MLVEKMNQHIEDFRNGKINMFDYMDTMHDFNKILFNFSLRIKNTEIQSIEIIESNVIFTLNNNIKMITDGSMRSAPLEMLNFSNYEKIDSEMVFKLVNDGDIIFDIGSHIGWFSICFAKKYMNSKIYSFEPISKTYNHLVANIMLNGITNISTFNIGLLDVPKTKKDFYYFKSGSVLSSLKNLIDHTNVEKISCDVDSLDNFISHITHNISQIDFLKADIEGCELLMFNGAIKSLNQFKPIIYTEIYQGWCEKFKYHANDIVHFLENLGYLCFSATSSGLLRLEKDIYEISKKMEKINFFFLHREKHQQQIDKYQEKHS